jgi:hypothetical protein
VAVSADAGDTSEGDASFSQEGGLHAAMHDALAMASSRRENRRCENASREINVVRKVEVGCLGRLWLILEVGSTLSRACSLALSGRLGKPGSDYHIADIVAVCQQLERSSRM